MSLVPRQAGRLKVIDPSSENMVTVIPHSPNGAGTIKDLVNAILEAAILR